MSPAPPSHLLCSMIIFLFMFFTAAYSQHRELLSDFSTDADFYRHCSKDYVYNTTGTAPSPSPGYPPSSSPRYNESNLVHSLLNLIVNSSRFSSYKNFTIFNPSSRHDRHHRIPSLYGLYQCRGDLSMQVCASCVRYAVDQLGSFCYDSQFGSLQLGGCYVKFDTTNFFGVEDYKVVKESCGPSIKKNETDNKLKMSLVRRDAVLARLLLTRGGSGGGSYYRAGVADGVKGVAQCTEDLSPIQCQDCLFEAIQRLGSDGCGPDYSGYKFLGKCYAWYLDPSAINSNGNKQSSWNWIYILAAELILIILTFYS